MNQDEARSILSALRSEDGGSSNPKIAEALEMMKGDRELAEWYAEIQQFDAIVSDRLQSLPVPPNLKAQLLTEIQDSRRAVRIKRLSLGILATAATLMIGLVVWQKLNPIHDGIDLVQTGTASVFQRDMLKEIEELKSIDHISNDSESIALFLETHGIVPDFEIPEAIELGKLAGCKVLIWKGHPVSLICFRGHKKEGMPQVHLVTLDAAAIDELKDGEERQMKVNQWSSTVWRVGDHIHLVAMKNRGKHDLRKMVPLG